MYMRSQVENHGEKGIGPVGTDLIYISSRHKTVDTLVAQIFPVGKTFHLRRSLEHSFRMNPIAITPVDQTGSPHENVTFHRLRNPQLRDPDSLHREDERGISVANIRICNDNPRNSCLNFQVVIKGNMTWLFNNLGGEIPHSPKACRN